MQLAQDFSVTMGMMSSRVFESISGELGVFGSRENSSGFEFLCGVTLDNLMAPTLIFLRLEYTFLLCCCVVWVSGERLERRGGNAGEGQN